MTEIDPSLELEYVDPREGDAEHTHADISNPNELLGDKPLTDSREGVAQCIDWYRDNQAWDNRTSGSRRCLTSSHD